MSRRGTLLILAGRISSDDIPALCVRARLLLEGCASELVTCDVGDLDEPDGVAVDALARLQLTARRVGRRVRFRRACEELQELLALVGLDEVVPCGPRSGLEPRGEAEEWEQHRRIQKEGDPGDPSV